MEASQRELPFSAQDLMMPVCPIHPIPGLTFCSVDASGLTLLNLRLVYRSGILLLKETPPARHTGGGRLQSNDLVWSPSLQELDPGCMRDMLGLVCLRRSPFPSNRVVAV